MSPRRAFSLAETLVALAVLLALLGALFGFAWDALRSRDRLEAEVARHRALDLLVDAIDAALLPASGTDDAGGPGVDGDGSSLRIASRVPRLARLGGDAPAAAFRPLGWTELRFDAATRTLFARRGGPGDADETEEVLGTELYRVRFRYHDGGGWSDAFTSGGDRGLPVAIEIAAWLDPWPGAEPEDPLLDEDGEPFEPDPRFGVEDFEAPDLGRDDFDDALEDEPPPPDRLIVLAVPDGGAGALAP